jgi:hypothetical protein
MLAVSGHTPLTLKTQYPDATIAAMAASRDVETARLVVVVKGYPTLSQTYDEAVGVAGVRIDTPEPRWIRLYPVQFRDLAFTQRFRKYQTITMRISSASDTRPESRRPDTSSLAPGDVLSTDHRWAKRWEVVRPLVVESMCSIQHQQTVDRTSLGIFKPREVTDFIITPDNAPLRPGQRAVLAQPSLFVPNKTQLEKIPFRFSYRYRCENANCNGHEQTIIDWEAAQAFRNFRRSYGEQEGLARMRDKWLVEMCGPTKNTHFFVGNQPSIP